MMIYHQRIGIGEQEECVALGMEVPLSWFLFRIPGCIMIWKHKYISLSKRHTVPFCWLSRHNLTLSPGYLSYELYRLSLKFFFLGIFMCRSVVKILFSDNLFYIGTRESNHGAPQRAEGI